METSAEIEFLEIFSSLQKLCHLTDNDLKDDDVYKHLRLITNIVYFYRKDGADKVKTAARIRDLAAIGVSVIQPKRKSK